jgi:hypothetical protein
MRSARFHRRYKFWVVRRPYQKYFELITSEKTDAYLRKVYAQHFGPFDERERAMQKMRDLNAALALADAHSSVR